MQPRTRKKAFASIFLVFILTFGQIAVCPLFAQLSPQDDKQQTRKPLPPVHYIRSRNFDVRHIALDLTFNWAKEQALGVEEFTFSPLTPDFRELVLDAGLMIFDSVKIKEGGDLEFKYDEDNARLVIRLDKPLNIGDVATVVIKYQTRGTTAITDLLDGQGGLKFVRPTEKTPNAPWQIRSQGWTEYNKYWFPSYDYPNDFRTSELKATVRKPLMVISNGRLLETRENSDNTRTYHWKMDTPHANYLTSIVVGEYIEVRANFEGIPISTYTYKDWRTETEVTVKRLPAMMKFFSEELKLKYPYPKYAQTIALTANGGMENISATTMTENMIQDARTRLDRDWDGLQAHELAHQWFGDWVTNRDWGESWLNESFATYLALLWDLESKGKDAFLYNNVRNQNQNLGAWSRGNRRPIVTRYYRKPESMYDSYAYQRGGAVLHMLRKQLGDENFWRALNHFLTSNANRPVSTEDFRIAIEESTGQSMDAFFDQWLYKMGHPVFEVSKSYDRAGKKLTLNVMQVQKMDMTSSYPQVRYFQTPVEIEIVTTKGPRIETVFIEPKEENVFRFGDVDSEPLIVDFDNEGTLIKELKFEKPVSELAYQLRNDGDVVGRGAALKSLAAKAKDKDTPKTDKSKILSEFTKASTDDGFWQLRLEGISEIRSILISGSTPQPFKLDKGMIAMLQKAAADPSSGVRAAAIGLLGETHRAAYSGLYQKAVINDPSYHVIDIAAIALANTKSDDAYAVLFKLTRTDSWRNRIQIAGLNGLAALGDNRAVDHGFKLGMDKTNPLSLRTAAAAVVAATATDDPRAFPLVFSTFEENLERNSYGGIAACLRSIVKLADPRGQEVFDLAMKWSGPDAEFKNLESEFKTAIKKN